MFFNSLGKKFERYSSRADLTPRQTLRYFVINEEDAAGPRSDVLKVMDIVKEFTRRFDNSLELQVYFTAVMARKGMGHLQALYIDRRSHSDKWQLAAVAGTYARENQRMLRYMRYENGATGWVHYAPIYDDGSDIHERPSQFSGSGWHVVEA